MQPIPADIYYLTEQDEAVVIERLALNQARAGARGGRGREHQHPSYAGFPTGSRRPWRRSRARARTRRGYSRAV
jgi:hypothetical protein